MAQSAQPDHTDDYNNKAYNRISCKKEDMYNTQEITSAPPSLSDRDFKRLSAFIYDVCGIAMKTSKRTMLESRLMKRMRVTGIASLSEYVDYLFSLEGSANEKIHMIDAVTTNKTDFFREPDHFAFLCNTVLPDLLDARTQCRNILIWSAGCSTGEEPYTLAMVLNNYRDSRQDLNYHILATDISTRVLDAAERGVYEEERVEPVPMESRRKYLLKSKDHTRGLVKIAPDVRSRVEFRRLNLMDNVFDISKPVDVVFCRNVIIYFDKPTQKRLLSRFHDPLRPGGYIFLGHSESMNGLNIPLVQVAPTVYRRPL
jgi:chemotaxis protein methyltransferase CheR